MRPGSGNWNKKINDIGKLYGAIELIYEELQGQRSENLNLQDNLFPPEFGITAN